MQLNTQLGWHHALIRLINRGGLSKADLFNSLINQQAVFRKHANSLVSIKHLQAIKEVEQYENHSVPCYQGKNESVLKLMAELNQTILKQYIHGAYLHGSLASEEEINYSDLDALVILSEQAFESTETLAKVSHKLNQITQLFYQYDPLQHHGWFVLTEKMLQDYPMSYFPPELFGVSKSLMPDKGLTIEINYSENSEAEYFQAFNDLTYSLKRNLSQELSDFNVFKLKSILSQFMLLPALFLQTLYQKSIDKKQSFVQAPNYFSDQEWEVMHKVSDLRSQWDYSLNEWQKFWLCHANYFIRKWGRRFAPKLKGELKILIEKIKVSEMLNLVELMEKKVQEGKL